jgi:hypothetical protein
VKKITGDKPIGVTINIHLEMSQENPCVTTFSSSKLKCQKKKKKKTTGKDKTILHLYAPRKGHVTERLNMIKVY